MEISDDLENGLIADWPVGLFAIMHYKEFLSDVPPLVDTAHHVTPLDLEGRTIKGAGWFSIPDFEDDDKRYAFLVSEVWSRGDGAYPVYGMDDPKLCSEFLRYASQFKQPAVAPRLASEYPFLSIGTRWCRDATQPGIFRYVLLLAMDPRVLFELDGVTPSFSIQNSDGEVLEGMQIASFELNGFVPPYDGFAVSCLELFKRLMDTLGMPCVIGDP